MPFSLDTHPVARNAGLVVDDRNAFFDDAIEERRLAYIRPSDDGDEI